MTAVSPFRPERFAWPVALDWETEVGRSSPEYVRWVQSSLNRALGLRLGVDGIAGPATRSAIRSFQQQRRLTVDGIVGPITEATLVAAGASPPPVSVSTTSSAPPVVIPRECAGNAGLSECLVMYDFKQGDDTPRPEHEPILQSIAKRAIGKCETSSLLIRGHASPEGPPEYNYDLARRRAQKIKVALAAALDKEQPGSSRHVQLRTFACGEKAVPGLSWERQRRVEVCFPTLNWFKTGGVPPVQMQPVRAGNDVQFFIDGATAFKAMVRDIRTATSRDHYIYVVGWWLDDSFELVPGDPNSALLGPFPNPGRRGLLWNADAMGVQVRAMLWHDYKQVVGAPNRETVAHINDWLSNGAAILDNRVLQVAVGTHHQKMLIVKGREGLIGFCGGVDINPDRIHTIGATPGAPFHDVHCRIKGPGAHELLKVFLERWKDHPDSARPGTKHNAPLRGSNDDPRSASVRRQFAGGAYVQIGRTYGSGIGNAGVPGGYAFARRGERTSREMVLHAIEQAKRFIYIEDQYLVSMDVSGALARALQRVPTLIVIILIPHGDVTAMGGQTRWRRWNFIEPLRRTGRAGPAGQQRFGVFFLGTRACAPGTYVHTKMLIADDEYAIVGSANLNRRSMTHDSEVGAGIFDPSENPFAKRLRVALWAKHLGLPASSLGDGVASARHWFALRPGTAAAGGVCVYQENVGVRPPANETERIERDALWSQIDPDGR